MVSEEEKKPTVVDVELSRLMMELFNRMTHDQKMSVLEEDAHKISGFLVANGYRLVFGRWYLQEEPALINTVTQRR